MKLEPGENHGHLSPPAFHLCQVTQGFLLRSESAQKRGSRDGHACLRLGKTTKRKIEKIVSAQTLKIL